MKVPILQYTDDTVVFIGDNREEATNLKVILVWFGIISRLTINTKKLNFILWVNHNSINKFAQIGTVIMHLSLVYT